MSSMPRRLFPAVLASVSVLLAGAALAWACTPTASIGISEPSTSAGNPSEPGATTITVTGKEFVEGGSVQIFWNGSGGQLATASGTSFSVPVTLPSAPPDTYTIFAVGRSANGAVAGRASASFVIPGPADPPDTGAREPARSPAANPSTGTTTGGNSDTNGSTSRTASGEGAGARSQDGNRAGAPAGGPSPVKAGGVATLASGASVFADSVAPSSGAKAATRGRAAKASSAGASERSAGGDLWSGFGSDTARGALGSTGGRAETPGSMPALAAALLGLGLVSVIAGVGVAGLRRRRRTSAAGQAHSD